MLDIKNMNDNEIINLIKLLKHELETRAPKNKFLCPRGEIKLTLESSVTNDKGQLFQNEPKKILFGTAIPKEIDDIFNQNGLYPIMVNQLVENFKEDMWNNQKGPLRMTWEGKDRFKYLVHEIQYYLPPNISEILFNNSKFSELI